MKTRFIFLSLSVSQVTLILVFFLKCMINILKHLRIRQ
jgi:hypothetical protein